MNLPKFKPFIAPIASILLIVGFAGYFVYSQTVGEKAVYINNVETLNLTVEASEVEDAFGAFITSGTSLTDLTITNDFVVDKLATFSSTTTIPFVRSNIDISLLFINTSTNVNGGTASTQFVIGTSTASQGGLLCNNLFIDMTTSLGAFEGSFQVGTTTGTVEAGLVSTSTATLLASSTIAATYASGDNAYDFVNHYFIDSNGDDTTSGRKWGSYWTSIDGIGTFLTPSSTVDLFVVKQSEVVVVTWTPYGATSTSSFLSSGGFNGVGRFHADCTTRL